MLPMKPITFVNFCKIIVLSTVGFLAAVAIAHAQISPPSVQLMDPFGVNAATGQLHRQDTYLSIGDTASDGLVWSYIGHSGSTQFSPFDINSGFVKLVKKDDGVSYKLFYAINLGNQSHLFKYEPCSIAACKNSPAYGFFKSSSTFKDNGDHYLYIDESGAEFKFEKITLRSSQQWLERPLGRLISIKKSNGVQLFINYDNNYNSLPNCNALYDDCPYRIKSIISSHGYLLKYDYHSGINKGVVKNIFTANMAISNCNINLNLCTSYDSYLTIDEPIDYDMVSISNVYNQKTHYTITTNIEDDHSQFPINKIVFPNLSEINLTYDFFGRVTSLTNSDGNFYYTYNDMTTDAIKRKPERIISIKDGSGANFFSASLNKITGSLLSVTDPTGTVIKYNFNNFNSTFNQSPWSQMKSVTHPEGNYSTYDYSMFNQISKVSTYPKTGNLQVPIITEANYPDTTCANPVTCNKPAWTKDAKGNVTDYTYDPIHGGVTSVTSPPDSNGVRAKIITSYELKTVYRKNETGSWIVSGNIWVPVTIRSCQNASECAGGASEIVKTLTYDPYQNLRLISVTERNGTSSIALTTTYSYDVAGNIISTDGPLAGTADTSYTTYDRLRRKIFEIGPDPDGAGPLKRAIAKNTYDVMGNVILTQIGTGTNTDGSDFVWSNATRTTYDLMNRPIKTEVLVP